MRLRINPNLRTCWIKHPDHVGNLCRGRWRRLRRENGVWHFQMVSVEFVTVDSALQNPQGEEKHGEIAYPRFHR